MTSRKEAVEEDSSSNQHKEVIVGAVLAKITLKLISVAYSAAPTVQLGFSSHQIKSTAEKGRTYILKAFESTFGCPVLVEMRADSRTDVEGGSSQINMNSQDGVKLGTSEIVEVGATPRGADRRTPEASQLVLEGASQKLSNMAYALQ